MNALWPVYICSYLIPKPLYQYTKLCYITSYLLRKYIFLPWHNPLWILLLFLSQIGIKKVICMTQRETNIPKEIYLWHPDSRQIYRTHSSFRWQLQIERCNVTILTCLFLSVSIFKLCWYIYILWSSNTLHCVLQT